MLPLSNNMSSSGIQRKDHSSVMCVVTRKFLIFFFMYFLMVLVSWFFFKQQDVNFYHGQQETVLKNDQFYILEVRVHLNCAVLTYM